MSLMKISLLSVFTLCLISAQAATFDIVNQCSYTVWPAATPSGGGTQLNSGQTWSINVPAGTSSGRVWGRTGCNFDSSGSGSCQTGDCGGALSCTLSGKSPLTLAEFTLNGGNNQDYFDISVIDGFNIPMQFAPTSNGCNNVRTCQQSSCSDAYQYPSDDTKTVSCPGGTNYKVVFCP
ncbi:thaumatin-like protein [Vicia villosa]|uniref:thaumatin-like protein n=1 Tax=Vicia villosa TaxID=3911 RepID=UPI00273C2400|nr:thaumatin-like protein [Vicia villosa]